MASLQGVLANIPGLGGYLAGQQQDQQAQMQQLAQMGALQKIAAGIQAQKEAQQLQSVVQQAGGNPEQTIQKLMATGHPKAIELATRMKSAFSKPEGQSIGSGGLRLPDGTIIPPAARPDKAPSESWSEPYQLGGATVQRNNVTGQIRTAVGREPQTRISMPQPVTPVTIQDPNDPTGTIVIDGRTRQVLGKGPKMTESGKIDAKTNLMMTGLGADLQSAEDLLMGVTRNTEGQVVKGNLPTASGIGSIYDAAAGFVGMSPSGAAEADALKTVAARLVSRIPRFEGPQSDKDVKLYQQAAGDAGNEKLPIPRRLMALRKMREIYAGYESGTRGRLTGTGRRSTDVPGNSDEPPPGAVRRRGG